MERNYFHDAISMSDRLQIPNKIYSPSIFLNWELLILEIDHELGSCYLR